MMIQVNTDNHITGREELVQRTEKLIGETLDRFRERISRVEVHLGDENSHKNGTRDQRCMIEARVEGLQPIAVTHHAASLTEAMTVAAERMRESLDSHLGRLHSRKMKKARGILPGTDVTGSGLPS
jgi:hypothetical protein